MQLGINNGGQGGGRANQFGGHAVRALEQAQASEDPR
jgi:hypothetical protein